MALRGKTGAGRRTAPTPRARALRRTPKPSRAAQLDQLAELERILSSGPQHFQLQFLSEVTDDEPAIKRETTIWAVDASAAASLAAAFPWPEGAFRMRIVDVAGRVVFKRVKPKRS